MVSPSSEPPGPDRSDGFAVASRRLLLASAVFALVAAILLLPPVAGPLASPDGEIESARFAGALWLGALLAAVGAAAFYWTASSRSASASRARGALAGLIEACWRRRVPIAVAALTLVVASVGGFEFYVRQVNRVDLLDRLEPSLPIAREVLEVARGEGDQAALARLADLSRRRPAAATLTHPELWDLSPAASAELREAFLAGELQERPGLTMIRWRPGDSLPWSQRSSSELALFLQRQTFLLHALRDSGAAEHDAVVAAARAFVREWAENNRVWPNFHLFAWSDDPTSNRMMAHMVLMDQLRAAGEVSSEEELEFLESLIRHADRLMPEEAYISGTNHGMAQNIALLEIALGYPELDRGGRFRQTAIERAERYLREAFTPQGVILELTPRYQWFGMEQALWFAARLIQAGVEVDSVFEETARNSALISREFLQPDRTLPMIADTHGFRRSLAGWPLQDLPDWPEIRDLAEATDRAEGPPNSPGVRQWPGTGYFVLRTGAPRWNAESSLMLAFKAGSRSRAHTHPDALSFTLYANGQPVLSGPGYPNYDRETRRDIVTGTPNQNTVSVDALSQRVVPARITFSDIRASPENDSAGPAFAVIQAEGGVYPGVLHRRSLFHGPSRGGVLVVDQLISDEKHDYRQHFRIANEAAGAVVEDRLLVSAESSGRFLLRVDSIGLVDGEAIPLAPAIEDAVASFHARARSLTYVSLLETLEDSPSSFTTNSGSVVWQGPNGSLSISLPLVDASGFEWRPTAP